MQPRRVKKIAIAVCLVVVASTGGCEPEQRDAAHFPPNAVSKDFFVGNLTDSSDDPEFYWRNFVIDGSEAQSLIGIGAWSAVDRIRWEITENLLIARRAYTISDGADDKGVITEHPADGTIVGA